ncbi:alpha/beta fold hydrolase [Oceanibium sediminis]|uniref:alpha/beta fold hydrolase n=1 Tax=Oceanibium sediminis TaxID=2026339 RepID=UPI000DD37F4A|nr:alpha/beta hydrolase [Oceanibium sediminis]
MSRFTTSDGVSLAYEDEGQGLPLLCLPGLTRDARDFDDLAAVLPDGVRLIRLTLRGRGESGWADDPATYQIPVEARDVLEFLDHLGLEKLTIVGTSRGGLIAMVLAAMATDRLAGVLLNDVGPVLDPAGLERILGYLGVPPKADTLEGVAAGLKANMGAEFPTLDDATWLKLARRWFLRGDGSIGLRYDPALRDAVIEASKVPPVDLWPFFDAFAAMPLAVVRGENSDLLTAATLARMQARNPEMIAATVPDRGHVPFLDEPEALAALTALLEKIRT